MFEYCREYLPPYYPVYGVHLMVLGKLHRLSGSLKHVKLSVKELTEVGQGGVCMDYTYYYTPGF